MRPILRLIAYLHLALSVGVFRDYYEPKGDVQFGRYKTGAEFFQWGKPQSDAALTGRTRSGEQESGHPMGRPDQGYERNKPSTRSLYRARTTITVGFFLNIYHLSRRKMEQLNSFK